MYVLFAVMFFVFSLIVWLVPTSPRLLVIFTGLVFIGTAAWSIPRVIRGRRKIRTLQLGRDGEKAVAEYLDTLRESGVRVLHDLIGEGFNIDHVLVSTKGVYTIETKTYSKPMRGSPVVEYDGETVRVGGFTPDRDPIAQSKAQASYVRRLIEDATGFKVHVRSVVVFPGWFVTRKSGTRSSVWVLEPKALGAWIENEATILRQHEVGVIVNFLKRHSRARVR